MPFQYLMHHAIVPLFFLFFVLSAAVQPPLPSLLRTSPSSANSKPAVSVLITVVFTALLFIILFSVYIIHCTGVPVNPDDRSRHGVLVPKGLNSEVIRGFSTFVYSEVKEHKIGKGSLECAICISEFKDYEMLRLIPGCDHVFHLECIDEWLSGHVTCPVCRTNLVLPPGDSVKDKTADSVHEVHDHVEIEIGELTLPADEATQGSGKEGGVGVLNLNRASKSRSGKRLRRLGRSHSTGHLLVLPGADTERFTLRLPDEVRKQILERPTTPYFPGEDSSCRGFRPGEGSSRGSFLRRLDWLDRQAKSERPVFQKMPSFLSYVSSIVSPISPNFANDDRKAGGLSNTAISAASRDPSGEPATERDRLVTKHNIRLCFDARE